MRKLLRSLRSSMNSTSSLLRPRSDGEDDGDDLSPAIAQSNQADDSNHEEEEEEGEEKDKKQGDNAAAAAAADDNKRPPKHPRCQFQQQQKGLDMSLEDLTRITKRDSKKERRYKYKQYFVRNNAVMVRHTHTQSPVHYVSPKDSIDRSS